MKPAITPLLLLLAILATQISAQITARQKGVICSHEIQRDAEDGILSWYEPDVPGAGYVHVCKLAAEFIKSGTPVDPCTGEKLYFISCCFQGPHVKGEKAFNAGKTWEQWMHNPACVFAGLVQGLVLDWRVFAGDDSYIDVVRKMLDHQLEFGTTPAGWPWANVPYASSDPGQTVYRGATRWESEGMRGDGLHGIEPDKVGELGIAYLKFYEVTEEKKYLTAAVSCADALAKHVRDVTGEPSIFSAANTEKSPWPFRVNARTGVVISQYCSNVIEPIALFDELDRIKKRIELNEEKAGAYKKARDLAFKWLYSKNGPMKTFIWNGYFEDIPNDPETSNRLQITPMETARYLIKHPWLDGDLETDIPALIYWVKCVFGEKHADAINEQTFCYAPMGSHTARYASICALWYEKTRDDWFKEQAYRFFNFASYMCYDNGVVAVGPTWLGSWFSDGYGDYIRHFMDGLAAVPEWAPAGENHLLRSTSVVQKISYKPNEIAYKTYDNVATEVLRITAKPESVTAAGKKITERKDLEAGGWTWQPLETGGVLRIRHTGGNEIVVRL